MKIHGLMVTYRRPAQAGETLRSVAEQSRRPDTLTVVDNAPKDDAEEILGALWGGEFSYLGMSDNLGPAGGIARGMKSILEFADPDDWVLSIDDDDPPPLRETIERLERLAVSLRESGDRVAGVAAVGARFDLRRGRVIRIPDHELTVPAVPVDHIGGNQYPLYSVAAIRDVGVFDESLFFGFEELEYGLRLVAGGWNLYCDGLMRLERRTAADRLGYGTRPASVGFDSVSWRMYYSRRNLLLILRRHGSWVGFARVAAVGLGKPVVNLLRTPRLAGRAFKLQALGVWHGAIGKTGRVVEPSNGFDD